MNYQKELDVILPLIKKAGREIMKIYEGEIKVELKEDEQPVTQADLLSNKIILEKLKYEFPSFAFLSEETPDDNSRFKCSKVFVIDPIDGTKGFIKKTGEFAIQIGMLENSEVVLGVIYLPAFDELIYATKGSGTYLEKNNIKTKLEIKKMKDFKGASIIMSKNHATREMINFVKIMGFTDMKQFGGIGVKFSKIIQNIANLDFKFYGGCSEWDLCAPEILVTEAGGFVYDTYGNPLKYNTKDKKISNGYIATSIDNKELILKAIEPFRE